MVVFMFCCAAKNVLQVFNLEIGKKVNATKLDDGETIQYWTWVNNATLGIVTDKNAYHWSIEGEFSRPPRPQCAT
jgi:hypothetical protein